MLSCMEIFPPIPYSVFENLSRTDLNIPGASGESRHRLLAIKTSSSMSKSTAMYSSDAVLTSINGLTKLTRGTVYLFSSQSHSRYGDMVLDGC